MLDQELSAGRLKQDVSELERQELKLALRLEELASTDCSPGACVQDPAMDSIEEKIEEVGQHKRILENSIRALER